MIVILLGMLGFALVHSITADKRVKGWMGQTLGERFQHGWYRLFYNVLSVISLAPIFLYMATRSEVIYSVSGISIIIFRVIQVIGLVGAAISILQIDWMRFVGLRQVMAYFSGAELPLSSEALKTDGVYGFVRHPLYFFSLLFLWLNPTMTDAALYFNIAASAYFVFGSIIEERRMRDYYGEHYKAYQARVPWLIPFIGR
ncbi:MAG: DUF1295 domain-containing protein [Phototrophicaceae bacterium]